MEKEKIEAIITELFGDEIPTGTCIVIGENNKIEVDGEDYKVLNNDEADEEFKNYQTELWNEMGITSFSSWAQNHIISEFVDKEWFDEYLEEHIDNYINDMEEEKKEEELRENRCEDTEELSEVLKEKWASNGAIQWYILLYGEEQFNTVLKEEDLVYLDDVIHWVKEEDGRGKLSSVNGEELKLENDFYAYKI